MVEHNLLLEFKAIFPSEEYSLYLNTLKEIPSRYIIDFATSFLRYRINDERISNIQNLLGLWFRKENEGYANELNKKIQKYQEASKIKVIVINEVTNLLVFEAGLNNAAKELKISEAEFEIVFFKIYIAYNQKSVEHEHLAGESTEKLIFPYRINALLVAQSLCYSDITEYNLEDSFVIQLAKTIFFFEEFSTKEEFTPLLNSFYEYYNVVNYKDFIKRYLGLSSMILKAKESGKIDVIISEGEDKKSVDDFVSKFAIPTVIDEDIDFKAIRSQPFLKVEEYKFRIISPLFVIEKLYNGLYFKLKEINSSLPQEIKVKDLHGDISFKFSEKKLLYNLLQRCCNGRYIQHNGESIEKQGINGFVDYYIRNGNKVFIFESKDILINAVVKQSYDFNVIEKELFKKLYYEEDKGKVIPKAVKQLINSIKILLDGQFTLDGKYKPNSIRIFPIIVLHNRQLEILGLNQIIKSWFREELNKLEKESYKIDKIHDPVIINIDSFINYSDQISDNIIRLEDVIDSYLDYTDQESLKKIKFKDDQHRSQSIRNTGISFSEFLRKRFQWRLPSIFQEKGYTLFS
jgi:hypothetical protein